MANSECIVTEPLTTILRLSTVLFAAPINLTRLNKKKSSKTSIVQYRVSISRARSICSCIVVTILMVTLYLRVLLSLNFKVRQQMFTRSLLSQILLAVQIISNSLIWLIVAFRGCNKMKNFIYYMNTLQELNIELGNNWMDMQFKRYRLLSWTSLLFPAANAILHTYVNTKGMTLENYKETSFIIIIAAAFAMMQTAAFLMQLQFKFIVSLLNGTLRVLNTHLKYYISGSKHLYDNNMYLGEIHRYNRNIIAIKIRHLLKKYISICKIISVIDEQEAILNLVLVAFGTINIMDFLCKLLSIKDDLAKSNVSGVLIFDVVWNTFRATILFLMMEPCHYTNVEFRTSQIYVSQLIRSSNDKNVKKQLFNFHYQVELDLGKFSPLGVLTLTRQLLVEILGALVTLFAILMQFNIKDKLTESAKR